MRRVLPAKLLAALRPDATARFELPGDLARDSRRRVRVAAALGVAAYAVFLAYELSGLPDATRLERSIDLAHDVLGLLLCFALWTVANRRAVGDRAVRAIALVAQVLLSALISIAVPWAGFIRTAHVATLTWVVTVIILFPLLVPTHPALALAVSLLCAATMPAGLGLLASSGAIEAGPADFMGVGIAGAVAAGIAVVASRTVYGAGRQVAAARAAGSYELLKPLGRGGMGEVWQARHTLLARPAAVKLILAEKLQGPLEAREEAVKRFTREAQVTANLCSPHTVELFDFGLTSEGALYYAMELLDGMNAEHFVYRFGPIEPRRAVRWLEQACHSLAEAHGQGLVHRDIKPGNLFLCRYGRDCDFVKILDFGLTKPVDVRDLELTSPGFRVGTPGYMAPEQILGRAPDPRSDLYALGCVAYWLLVGRKPFEAEAQAELLRLHVQESPPPLAGRALHPVPRRLEELVMACLAKDPADRPRDAERLGVELGKCLDGAPWTAADARAWWDENLKKS